MNYSYYELINVCETISTQIDTVITILQQYLPPILSVLTFALLLKVGFSCLRGYKV